MKTVLVILTRPDLSQLQVSESLSATMVLATFGCEVKVLLKEGALSLLQAQRSFDSLKYAFKPASNLVDSFEFYDLTPILVESTLKNSFFVTNSEQEIEFVDLNHELIQTFDHVLYW